MTSEISNSGRPAPPHWPNCLNVREVGGTPLAGGAVVRHGALFRSDHHGRLNEEGLAAVRAIGPAAILDLRTAEECRRDPSPFVDTLAYRHVPFEDPFDPTRPDGRLAEVYKGTLDRYRTFVGAAVVAVAEASAGPVIVQCHAGKDRTGLLVALLLLAVGATAEVVAEEYARSHAPLRPRYDPVLATITDPEEYDRRADRMSAIPDTMLAALAHLDQRYGGYGPYLAGAGVHVAALASLRTRLEEGAGHA